MQFANSVVGKKIRAFSNGRAICPTCSSSLIAKCGELNIWHWAHESRDDCDSWNYEPKTEWHTKWQKLFGEDHTEVFIKQFGECHRADIVTKSGLVIEIQNSAISPSEIYSREEFYEKMIWVINSKEFKHQFIIKNYAFDVLKEVWFKWVNQYDPGQELAFAVTVPIDDHLNQIIPALKANKFQKGFDQVQKKEFWYIKRYTHDQGVPKEVINAFSSYLLDIKLSTTLDDRLSYRSNFKWQHLRKIWTTARMPLFIDLNNGYLFYIKTLHENGNGFGKIISRQKFLKKYRDNLSNLKCPMDSLINEESRR